MLKLVINAKRPSTAIDKFTADTEHKGISGYCPRGYAEPATNRISVTNRGPTLALEIMTVFGAQSWCG